MGLYSAISHPTIIFIFITVRTSNLAKPFTFFFIFPSFTSIVTSVSDNELYTKDIRKVIYFSPPITIDQGCRSHGSRRKNSTRQVFLGKRQSLLSKIFISSARLVSPYCEEYVYTYTHT